MARSKSVVDRLKAEQEDNPKIPHYDCKPGESCWPLQPEDIKTSRYWKLERRRVLNAAEPAAFVVSGHGGKLHGTKVLTRWVPAFHITQTVVIKTKGNSA